MPKESDDDNLKFRWSRRDRHCGTCGMLVIHARSTFRLTEHYWDMDEEERLKFFCSRRCLNKARELEQQGPLF